MEKFHSGKRDQGDRELGVSFGGLVFVASQRFPGRDLVTEKQYLKRVLQQRGLTMA